MRIILRSYYIKFIDMKAMVTVQFEVECSDWYEGERFTREQRKKKIKEDLEDYSCFMIHLTYENFKDVEVEIG